VALIIVGAWYFNQQRGAVKYQDGTYEGKSATDDHGNYGTIKITVKDGKITQVDYVEYTNDGKPKGSDYSYQQAIEAMPEYESRLVKAQDPNKVDKISGATGTWNKFKEAANNALAKAK